MQSFEPLQIEIVSDVVCPWCVIGYRRLKVALEGIEHEIRWHPFELNPNMPVEGQNLREHLAQKYGSTLEQSIAARARLTALGADVGFTFAYADDMRMVNTFKAHQLMTWAGEIGGQSRLADALFAGFFSERRDLADAEVLVGIAARAGFDAEQAAAISADGRYAQRVRSEEQHWLSQGIQGVPAIIFDRRFLVTGAREVADYREILQRVRSEAQTAGPA